LVNATHEPREFIIPPVARGLPWRQFIDTAEPSPYDIYPQADGPRLPETGRLTVPYRSLTCFVAEQ
jgi:glycogen operon protein